MSDEEVNKVKSINHSGLAEMIAVSFTIVEGQLPFQAVTNLAKKTLHLEWQVIRVRIIFKIFICGFERLYI